MRALSLSILATLLTAATGACAEPAPEPEPASASAPLTLEVAALDAKLTAAFDAHDLPALMALFTDDLEFFHDTGGLQHFAEVKAGFGGLFGQNNGIHRTLVPGTLKVYPIKDYGAIELGSHRFCHIEKAKEDCGTFAFVHVWRKSAAGWKIARVVSYGH
ncbi:MAG TPA: nuclear transport factor 2 family protein [Burkholderiaceae bacterium]